jgi:hypothetical protein
VSDARKPGQPMSIAQAMSFLAANAMANGFAHVSIVYRISAIRRLGAEIEDSLATLRANRRSRP